MKRLATTVGTLAMVCVLLAGLAGVLLQSPVAQAVPALRGSRAMVVLSGSMEPSIRVGSVLFTRAVQPGEIRPGDVITFVAPAPAGGASTTSRITTHRVTAVVPVRGKAGIGFKTKGDANNAPDSWTIPAASVLGRQVATIPLLGYVGAFARSRPGFLLLIVLPACILVVIEILGIAGEVRDARARKKSLTEGSEQVA